MSDSNGTRPGTGPQTILVPIDFSKRSLKALRFATALAEDNGARLRIIHVKEHPVHPSPKSPAFSGQSQARHESRLLDEVTAGAARIPCEHEITHGDPAEEILRVASEGGVDLIVMATHGRRGLRRALMGSVAEAVLRRADCPVMTCKLHDREPGGSPQAKAAGDPT